MNFLADKPWAKLAMLLVLNLQSVAVVFAVELPRGFAGVNIGIPWTDVELHQVYTNMTEPTSEWDSYVADCGYRHVKIVTDNGEILVTAYDYVVTAVSFVTPIQVHSDLLSVADLVIETYGQPDSAAMRSMLGKVTLDRDQVNYVSLEYSQPIEVLFTISGRELWQYQIQVRHEKNSWYENKMLRCARKKEKEASPATAAETEATDS